MAGSSARDRRSLVLLALVVLAALTVLGLFAALRGGETVAQAAARCPPASTGSGPTGHGYGETAASGVIGGGDTGPTSHGYGETGASGVIGGAPSAGAARPDGCGAVGGGSSCRSGSSGSGHGGGPTGHGYGETGASGVIGGTSDDRSCPGRHPRPSAGDSCSRNPSAGASGTTSRQGNDGPTGHGYGETGASGVIGGERCPNDGASGGTTGDKTEQSGSGSREPGTTGSNGNTGTPPSDDDQQHSGSSAAGGEATPTPAPSEGTTTPEGPTTSKDRTTPAAPARPKASTAPGATAVPKTTTSAVPATPTDEQERTATETATPSGTLTRMIGENAAEHHPSRVNTVLVVGGLIFLLLAVAAVLRRGSASRS